jgi:acid stress-induced BolA-like protein IbaG/YrbA
MDATTVEALLREALTDVEVRVDGAGAKYDILVIGEAFEGLRELKRQQLVYAAIREPIATGSIHAVNIRTFTPGEWAAKDS